MAAADGCHGAARAMRAAPRTIAASSVVRWRTDAFSGSGADRVARPRTAGAAAHQVARPRARSAGVRDDRPRRRLTRVRVEEMDRHARLAALELEAPIIQAPMGGGPSTPELVAA